MISTFLRSLVQLHDLHLQTLKIEAITFTIFFLVAFSCTYFRQSYQVTTCCGQGVTARELGEDILQPPPGVDGPRGVPQGEGVLDNQRLELTLDVPGEFHPVVHSVHPLRHCQAVLVGVQCGKIMQKSEEELPD